MQIQASYTTNSRLASNYVQLLAVAKLRLTLLVSDSAKKTWVENKTNWSGRFVAIKIIWLILYNLKPIDT